MIEHNPIEVRLLGPPTIERDGQLVSVDTRKAVALLAKLLVDRRGHSRASLVAMFWPESDETHGRGALRRTLYALSQALLPGVVAADRDQIRLAAGDHVWCDIDVLERAYREAVDQGAPCDVVADRLRSAVGLYRGDFLQGFALKGSPDFEDWQFFQGEAYRRMHVACLERLIGCLRETGALELGLEYATQWLTLDSLDENAHAAVIELLALSGNRAGALRHYEHCRRVVESELGGEPSPRIVSLVERIMAGAHAAAGPGSPGGAETPAAPMPTLHDRHPATLLVLRLSAHGSPAASDSRLLSALYGLVLRFGGRIERHAERHLLVVFGRASTRENAPELAVRAAVEARALASRLGRPVAIGLSSGIIEVSQDDHAGGPEHLSGSVIQEALETALAAGGDEIVVSESTYRGTRRVARFAPLPGADPGRYALRGLVKAPGKPRGIEGHRGRLIGRSRELETLASMVGRVLGGESAVATLSGEAGVGKSRLISDVRNRTYGDGRREPLFLEGRCLDLGVAATYWPFIDIVRQLIGWEVGGAEADRASQLESFVAGLGQGGRPDTVRYLATLLSAELPPPLPDEDPERVREGVFRAVRAVFVALARKRPLILVFEDLHWADSPSLDLIRYLMDAIAGEASSERPAIGIVCVYRPARDHACRHLSLAASQKCPDRHVDVVLQELSPTESRELVESLLASDQLPEQVMAAVLERGQGNPFFLEEVVRALIETRSIYRKAEEWMLRSEATILQVPEHVESVIRGTTDLLPESLRSALRAASVLGRSFDAALLGGMIEAGDLEDTLNALQDRALVYEERAVPRREFSFRHVLTRDAVYAGIPDEKRRALHASAAAAIRSVFGDHPEPHVEQLAFQYEAAGERGLAVHYLHEAGRKAIRAGNNESARALIERALRIVRGRPDGPDLATEELDLLLTLGVPVTATTGYGSPETRDVYQRANDLTSTEACSERAFKATYGLWRYHTLRGDVPRAMDLAIRLRDMAEELADDTIRLEALRAHGCLLVHAGRFREAEELLVEGLGMYRPEKHGPNAFVYGHDPAATLLGYRAINLWSLGYPDQATAAIVEMRALVETSSHRLSVAYAHAIGSVVDQLTGRPERVRESCGYAIELCSEGRIPMFRTIAEVLLAWADAAGGDLTRGIEGMSAGLEAWETVGGGAFRPYMKCLLADAHRRRGSCARAMGILADVEGEVRTNGERWYEPEVYRLQGEAMLVTGRRDDAMDLFERALTVAREIGSRALALRAATSRVRADPRRAGALDDLHGIYAGFVEGLETPDLRTAASVLGGSGS